jgi:tripartite-type tricarboxylate transporter receptor subunit TctC
MCSAMRPSRRQFLYFAIAAAAARALSPIGLARAYPVRPVHIIVGFPAGTAPDMIARLLAERLSQQLDQQFVVENRPGAGSKIATESVMSATPDGSTLLLATSANAINSPRYTNLSFDFSRDIVPVGMIVRLPFVMLANIRVEVKSVPEFIAYARANPGKITMGSRGNGSATHVIGELFKIMAGVDLVHVPYRGDYMADLLGGHLQVAFAGIADCLEQIADAKLRALGVTDSRRHSQLPDIPAIAEFLPGYEAVAWLGITAPPGTSEQFVDRLNTEINIILDDPGVKSRLLALGAEPTAMTPAAFREFIAVDTEKWARVIKFAHIAPD